MCTQKVGKERERERARVREKLIERQREIPKNDTLLVKMSLLSDFFPQK
jgi:hypothetical protein